MASVPTELERHFKVSIDAINNWRPHILRYFEHRYTSGYVERLNGLIRTMDRNGAGYSFEVLRAKALLKHGQTGEQITLGIGARQGLMRTRRIILGVPLSTLEAGTF